MINALRIAVSGLLLAAAVAGAAGTSYRWTDAQGRVHFGDLPPPGASNVVTTSGAMAATSAAPSPAAAATSLGAEECQRRQKQLEGYQNAATITETDGLGNRRDYTEDERQKLIARTQQAITDGCPQGN